MALANEEMLRKMAQFRSLPLTNMVWALATLRSQSQSLLEPTCQRVLLLLQEYNPQQVANSLWGTAKLGVRHAAVERLCQRVLELMSQFDAQKLANSIWGLANLQVSHTPLLREASRHCQRHELSAQHCANVAWACAHLARLDLPLLASLATRFVAQLDHARP